MERPIILKAKQYREWHRTARTDTKILATPDAIHLATAYIYGAREFHTFDDGGKKGCSLLKLSENIAGDKLKICRPHATQQMFSLPPTYSEATIMKDTPWKSKKNTAVTGS